MKFFYAIPLLLSVPASAYSLRGAQIEAKTLSEMTARRSLQAIDDLNLGGGGKPAPIEADEEDENIVDLAYLVELAADPSLTEEEGDTDPMPDELPEEEDEELEEGEEEDETDEALDEPLEEADDEPSEESVDQELVGEEEEEFGEEDYDVLLDSIPDDVVDDIAEEYFDLTDYIDDLLRQADPGLSDEELAEARDALMDRLEAKREDDELEEEFKEDPPHEPEELYEEFEEDPPHEPEELYEELEEDSPYGDGEEWYDDESYSEDW